MQAIGPHGLAVPSVTSASRTASKSTARNCSTARPSPRWPGARAAIPAQADRSGVERKIDPGKVFDLVMPLDQVAEGYRAMDERRAIKTLLQPSRTS